MKATKKNLERVKLLARDLRGGKQFPRSPRDTYAGYVLAARAVDKCRAVLAGTEGEYHSNCPLDQIWLKFAGIDYDAFRSFVATGATDDQIATWIGKNAKKRPRTGNHRLEQPATGHAPERTVARASGIHGGLHPEVPAAPPRRLPLVRCVRFGRATPLTTTPKEWWPSSWCNASDPTNGPPATGSQNNHASL